MSDPIKHECGIALIRLLKPLSFYREKYGTALYGLKKLYLLMEKQHNRGQDGAGVVTIKLNPAPGKRYISRKRSVSSTPIKEIFAQIFQNFEQVGKQNPDLLKDSNWLKENVPYAGELLLGHLRYGTHGANTIESCHPFLRQNNWMTRNLVVAGNFNLTNVEELFDQLVELGQHPKEKSDTVTVMEKIGHFLDMENQILFDKYKEQGFSNMEISDLIARNLDVANVLKRASRNFDGGFTMAGLMGHGDAFVLRDPNGIRPAFYFLNEEIAVVASERPAIQTAFNVHHSMIKEIPPGHALVLKKDGKVDLPEILPQRKKQSCSFERIYFSRGTDKDIYQERKKLGNLLAPAILKAINYDLENTVFSFVPNTAEVAFYGLLEGIEEVFQNRAATEGRDLNCNPKIRVEKLIVKDAKLRTFITEDSSRDDLVSHVYDIAYGSICEGSDTIVLLDDSIVRGTTLQQSILSNIDRLGPKKIIVVSSAPQIRYPDCYGIDMSRLKDFVAFRALIALIKERKMENLLEQTYQNCLEQIQRPASEQINALAELYAAFTEEEISAKISEIVRPNHIFSDVQVVYQTIENLHIACPDHLGDWYFSGNYPTPGGVKVVNRAFINFREKRNERAY